MMLLGYEQKYNPGYSKLEKAYIAIFGMPVVGLRIRARNVFALIPKERQYGRILDAGCGPGVFSFELARCFPAARITGVDIREENIEACRHMAEKIGSRNLKFIAGSIEDLESDEPFDLIVCVDILEHIADDAGALKSLYQAAAPGGILVLHVPALYRRYPIWKKALNFHVESHVRRGYEPFEIQDKIRDAGFMIRDSGFTYGFWETLVNNLSYMITHARMENKLLYSVAFPALYMISWIGARARPVKLGAGVFVIGGKPES